ncbi:MAG: TetR/AcrR family transcriptional regulator [Candidatus Deferrimicrobiota bacterium]
MSTGKTTTLHEERARATRRKILVEATRLFARQGFHKTTVSDLARAIGMTPGALFYHFPSKRAILEAVVDRMGRGFGSYRTLLQDGGELEDIVRRVAARMLRFFAEQPEATVCLVSLATEFAGTDDPVLEKICTAYDGFIDPFAAVLSGHPKVREPRRSAIAFLAAVEGVAVQTLLRGGAVPAPELVEGLLDILNIMEKRQTS